MEASPSMEMEDSPSSLRHMRKLRMIFEKHDADGDGRLSRDEMAALVGAVNSIHVQGFTYALRRCPQLY